MLGAGCGALGIHPCQLLLAPSSLANGLLSVQSFFSRATWLQTCPGVNLLENQQIRVDTAADQESWARGGCQFFEGFTFAFGSRSGSCRRAGTAAFELLISTPALRKRDGWTIALW